MQAFADFRRKIREINERFRTPSLEMSPRVRYSLLALRIYLLLLVALMAYRFVTLVA
jgi:hypothetical protein